MTIVCLGWGSLIWNPGDLPISGKWRPDGPALPLEFSRQSGNGRITLVVTQGAEPVTVLWAALKLISLDDARHALAAREGISLHYVDRSVGFWSPDRSSNHREAGAVGTWATAANVTGVVWTALQPRFGGKSVTPSSDDVLGYLSALEGETKRLAEEYVRLAPAQIRTAYRDRIARELGWTVAVNESP